MKNIRIILAATATAILMGCSPTLATKTVSVTTYPDGKKETVERKELKQTFSTPQTTSTDDVISSCGK
ncbi:MAG: hypothetical protein WCK27_19605 [Verrucomicrobiota bacterium]